MIKNREHFLLFGALFALGTALFAQTEVDFEVAFTEDGNGVVIKKYTGKVTNTIRIPATIEGLPVREIGEAAFIGAGTVYDAGGMMKTESPFAVVLPQGLIKIGYNAFAGSALTSVVIPDSVTEIGAYAFANYEFHTRTGNIKPAAPSLTTVTLPNGLAKVGQGAFKGNSALKTVVIPDGCSVLGEEMFADCTALATITIPKSVASIPSSAFARCTGLKTLVLPEGLTEICGSNSWHGGAFFACTALTSVTLPSTITAIGESAFSACSALTTVTISDSVETIDGGKAVSGEKTLLEWAFPECGKLNLATQSRLKKIVVVSFEKERQEQARKQRKQEEEARRAQEKREREEREAQVQAERAAQAKREQEEREAQRQREEERAAQEKREQDERKAAQAAQEKRAAEERIEQTKRAAEATRTASEFKAKFVPFAALASSRMNKKQFAEFMDVYEKYIASGLKNLDTSRWGYSERQDFELCLSDIEGSLSYCMRAMTDSQKKKFNATKFK